MFSGSHRQSLRELQQENADIAAIDCVTYALLQRYQPQALAGLVAIGWSPAAPGLPLITAGATPAATLNSLREALQQLVSDDRYRSLCDALLICGYSDMSREAYAPLLAWRDEAAALGSASYRRNARASDLRRAGYSGWSHGWALRSIRR